MPEIPMKICPHLKHLVVYLTACAVAGGAAVAGSAPVYSVATRGLTLQFDGQGHITGGTVGEGKLPLIDGWRFGAGGIHDLGDGFRE